MLFYETYEREHPSRYRNNVAEQKIYSIAAFTYCTLNWKAYDDSMRICGWKNTFIKLWHIHYNNIANAMYNIIQSQTTHITCDQTDLVFCIKAYEKMFKAALEQINASEQSKKEVRAVSEKVDRSFDSYPCRKVQRSKEQGQHDSQSKNDSL